MLDGIDGLCATLAVLALQHTALAINIIDGSLPDRIAFTSIYLSGCLAGFLAFNLQRSSKRKIFLGDSGAMFLGLVVSVLTIVSFGQSGTGISVSTGNYPAIALWVLAIPLADILTTSVTRILSGKNPMSPDQTHIHHRLIDAGLSKLQALCSCRIFLDRLFCNDKFRKYSLSNCLWPCHIVSITPACNVGLSGETNYLILTTTKLSHLRSFFKNQPTRS